MLKNNFISKESTYYLGPFRFLSMISIPELENSSGEGTIDVQVAAGPVPESLPDGVAFDRYCDVSATDYLLKIPGTGQFLASSGCRVQVQAESGAAPGDVSTYLLGSIFGALSHQNGMLPLHASAVASAQGVTAFLGASGAGKSTLAAFLARRGHQIVSDDICLLVPGPDGLKVVPVAGWLKLWRESFTRLDTQPNEANRTFSEDDKYRHYLPSTQQPRLPLRNLVFLARSSEPAAAPRLEPLAAAETIALTMEMIYLPYIVQLTGQQARAFRECAAAVRGARGFRLNVPWGWDAMETVLDLIERDVFTQA